MQAAMLKSGQRRDNLILDDVQIRDRFGALANSVNDWAITYFKDLEITGAMSKNVVAVLRKVVPQYQTLMRQPRTKYLVVRAIVAKILFEAFDNGDLLGSQAFSKLHQEFCPDRKLFAEVEFSALLTK